MKKCPNCGNDTFYATAHVVELWKVDNNGNHLETIDCLETAHYPDDDDLWECEKCGYEASGYEFEAEDDDE